MHLPENLGESATGRRWPGGRPRARAAAARPPTRAAARPSAGACRPRRRGHPVTGPVNIASGDARSVADVIQLIGEATGRLELVQWGARQGQDHEPEGIEADVSRLADEVKFTPRFRLEEGIQQTVAWWREQLQLGS